MEYPLSYLTKYSNSSAVWSGHSASLSIVAVSAHIYVCCAYAAVRAFAQILITDLTAVKRAL